MSLPSLPAEVKLNIVEYLDPESNFNFALSSKTHYVLCQEQLREHARLFAKLSVVRPSDDGYLIWDFTREVLQDPRKGWYVRELNLVKNRPSQHPNLPEEDQLLFKAAAEEILPLYPYNTDFFDIELSDAADLDGEMDDDIDRGFEEPILVLLIHHMPRLRSFRMTDRHMSDMFQVFMRRVAANYQDTSLAKSMPLQHLRLAAIAHDDTENSCSVDLAVYFMCIPSLETFGAFMMGSELICDDPYGENSEEHLRYLSTSKTPVSNVKHLHFQDCQFDPNSFDTLLPMVKNLKTFYYEAGGHTVTEQDYEPRKVIRALIRHAGHSLEELRLAEVEIGFQDGDDDISSISARGFKRLKTLSCEMRWLLHRPKDLEEEGDDSVLEDDEEIPHGSGVMKYPDEECVVFSQDPRDNLPVSLEYLYLTGVYDNEEWERTVEMFKTRNANTPRLTLESMCIERNNGSTFGHAAEPRAQFARRLPKNVWSGHNVWL